MVGSCLPPRPTASCPGHGHQPVPKPSCPLADVTDPNSIKAAVGKVREEVGSAGLNLLINNAGTTRHSTLATETAENMTLVYTTNTIGPLQTSQVSPQAPPAPHAGSGEEEDGDARSPQAFLPLLKEAAEAEGQRGMSCSRAAIINISSILGSIEAAEAWEERQDVCYRCSKVLLPGERGGIWGEVTSCGIPARPAVAVPPRDSGGCVPRLL